MHHTIFEMGERPVAKPIFWPEDDTGVKQQRVSLATQTKHLAPNRQDLHPGQKDI